MTKNNTKMTSIIAITFFAALMLIPAGMNTNAFAAPTFEDDFTTDNWVDQDSAQVGVDTMGLEFDYDVISDATNDASSYDIGYIIDDTWVLTWKDTLDTLTDAWG